MSELQHALELFGYLTIDEVTVESLKKSFKVNVLRSHPDKDGDADVFNNVLASYNYLYTTLVRINGGRETLKNIMTPDELRELRPDELVNKIFEEYQNEAFNTEFEKHHKAEGHGYLDWLKSKDGDTNVIQGKYGEATQVAPDFDEKDFNRIFEEKVRKDKPEVEAIILHPEAMAYLSGQVLGTSIIEETGGSYTSELFTNPEYTDVYKAFTTENTISDKITNFGGTTKTFDDINAERAAPIEPLNDSELRSLQEFEKAKLDKNIRNLTVIKEHFELGENTASHLTNWPPEKYSEEAYKGFVFKL